MSISLICKICNKSFNRIQSLGSHVVQKHKISKEEYYLKHLVKFIPKNFCGICKSPTRFQNLIVGYGKFCSGICAGKSNKFRNKEEKKKISIATKKAMTKPDVRKKFLDAIKKPKSVETIKKLSNSAKQRFIKNPLLKDKIYTKKRNKKISISKKKYWKTADKTHISNLWKRLKEKDENKWKRHLLKASQLGFKKMFSDGGETKLEKRMYEFLEKNNIQYQKQYELDYKLYDAYLLEYNILLEFDGEFWHKLSLTECVYPFQKNSFYNDLKKNKIAKDHNIPLFRIRENELPEKILECINSIK